MRLRPTFSPERQIASEPRRAGGEVRATTRRQRDPKINLRCGSQLELNIAVLRITAAASFTPSLAVRLAAEDRSTPTAASLQSLEMVLWLLCSAHSWRGVVVQLRPPYVLRRGADKLELPFRFDR
jgi:hypothetical protein